MLLFLLGCNQLPPVIAPLLPLGIGKRNIQQPSSRPIEFITVTGELRPVNLTCVAVGEFGSNTQVVTVNVIGKLFKFVINCMILMFIHEGPSGAPSMIFTRFLMPSLSIPLPVNNQQLQISDPSRISLFDLEHRVSL